MTTTSAEPIRPEDIQAKFQQVRGGVDEVADSARDYALIGGGILLLVLVLTGFLLGRRKGKLDRTMVEIRRV